MHFGHISEAGQSPQLFAADDTGWILVADTLPGGPETVDDLVLSGETWLEPISAALANEATPGSPDRPLAAPLSRPPTVIAIGLNYADHCREFGTEPPGSLIVFSKHRSSVVGPGEDVRWSTEVTDSVDWEAELGVVIGRSARNVSVADALDFVFGYTVINDVTARDIQRSEQQWVRAKSLETFCPIGPVVVPARDIPDPQALAITTRINGATMQDSHTGEMIFSVAQIIADLSASFTLLPGDVIATGTPLGVGAFRTPPFELSDGDVMEIEIEGIGTLVNTCRTNNGGQA